MTTIGNNSLLMAEIGRIAEVAGYLWTKGWAERNGGNISVNLTGLLTPEEMEESFQKSIAERKKTETA